MNSVASNLDSFNNLCLTLKIFQIVLRAGTSNPPPIVFAILPTNALRAKHLKN
jgi:hypothetical protein